MKELYSFPVKIQDEEIIVAVSKPSNSDIEDAEFVYGQKFNQLLNDGFLSKAMMNKKFGDIGGLHSAQTDKEISEAVKELLEARKIIEFYSAAETLTDEQKDKLTKAEETFALIQASILENDANLKEMYSQSADNRAQEYMIKWFVLNSSWFYEEVTVGGEKKKEAFRLFDKPTFAEKKEQLNELLEDIDETDPPEVKKRKGLVKDAVMTITKVISIWYNGFGSNKEEIDKSLEKLFPADKKDDKKTEDKPKKTVRKRNG